MIHQYKLNGYNIVLDCASGAIHLVDELAYDIIARFEEYTDTEIVREMLDKYAGDPEIDEGEIRECLDDVRELKEKGQLFSPDIFAASAEELAGHNRAPIKALCLHVAHTCNLSCDYCFAAQGKYHGERALMSLETGKRALDFLVENSGNQKNLEVDFFGGEPLMNWDVVKGLVEYGRSLEKQSDKRFRFTLTTNGVLVNDEVIEFSNREFSNVVMSLDGRAEIHDLKRKTPNGQGSYELIVPKFQRFAKARGDGEYYIRGTYTSANPDFAEDVLHMADLGFDKLSMEPVVCAPDDPNALTSEDLPLLFEQYEKLSHAILESKKNNRPLTFYHYMLSLESGPCIYKRLSGCGSGTQYLAVTPNGELYPCHQFVGEEGFSMGNIWDGVTNIGLRDAFGGINAYSREECRGCWARLYCSGGCAANAFKASGDIKGVYEFGCELFRKRVECAIMLKIAEEY
jgi:uncharacterized protein